VFAVPFDLKTLSVSGTPVPVLNGVLTNELEGWADYWVSENGTLVYVPDQAPGPRSFEEMLDAVKRKIVEETSSRNSLSQNSADK